MPPPPVFDDALFDDFITLPPPPPLLTSCRESMSAPKHYHPYAASASYYDLPDSAATDNGRHSSEVIRLTSPAATYKEQGREISGLRRAFSRTSVDTTSVVSGKRRSGAVNVTPLPRHPPLLSSKSSPALHRSPSNSPHPLSVHKEESSDVSGHSEDKHYLPSDCTTLLSSSTESTSVSALASSPSTASPSPYLCASSCAVLTPSSHRSLSAHVNPFRTQAAVHRTLPATPTATTRTDSTRQRRVSHCQKKNVEAGSRTASTASTCSMASTSLSNLTSPSFAHCHHNLFFNADSNDNDADLDSDSEESDNDEEEEEEEDSSRHHRTPSHSPPTHFTFPAKLSLQSSASFSCSSSCSSSSSNLCSSPHSPLFDSSLSNGRHSADRHFSAGIGVFAGQLQALRRMRSANTLTSPTSTPTAGHTTSGSSRSQTSH